MTCPARLRSSPTLIVESPVTHTAEADVKRASTHGIGALVAEKGSQINRPPVNMTPAKLKIKIRSGDKWRVTIILGCQECLASRSEVLCCFMNGEGSARILMNPNGAYLYSEPDSGAGNLSVPSLNVNSDGAFSGCGFRATGELEPPARPPGWGECRNSLPGWLHCAT